MRHLTPLLSLLLLCALDAPAAAQDVEPVGRPPIDEAYDDRLSAPDAVPTQTVEVAPLDPEDFDLEGVAALVRDGDVKNAQELQDLLNKDNGLNNVDLDDDGLVDHVIVRELREQGKVWFEFLAVPSSSPDDPAARAVVARLILQEQIAEQSVEVVAEYSDEVNDADAYVYVYNVVHPYYAPAPLGFYSWVYAPGRPVWAWTYAPSYYGHYYYYSDYGTLVTVRSSCYHRYGVRRVHRYDRHAYYSGHHRRYTASEHPRARRREQYRTRQHATYADNGRAPAPSDRRAASTPYRPTAQLNRSSRPDLQRIRIPDNVPDNVPAARPAHPELTERRARPRTEDHPIYNTAARAETSPANLTPRSHNVRLNRASSPSPTAAASAAPPARRTARPTARPAASPTARPAERSTVRPASQLQRTQTPQLKPSSSKKKKLSAPSKSSSSFKASSPSRSRIRRR